MNAACQMVFLQTSNDSRFFPRLTRNRRPERYHLTKTNKQHSRRNAKSHKIGKTLLEKLVVTLTCPSKACRAATRHLNAVCLQVLRAWRCPTRKMPFAQKTESKVQRRSGQSEGESPGWTGLSSFPLIIQRNVRWTEEPSQNCSSVSQLEMNWVCLARKHTFR